MGDSHKTNILKQFTKMNVFFLNFWEICWPHKKAFDSDSLLHSLYLGTIISRKKNNQKFSFKKYMFSLPGIMSNFLKSKDLFAANIIKHFTVAVFPFNNNLEHL